MKGCFTLFIGMFLILIGIEIILKFFFKITIPFMKILFAFLFIYIGVSILVGKPLFKGGICGSSSSDAFGTYSNEFKGKDISSEKLSIVFGEKKVDLTGMKIKGDKAFLKLDCVFGEMNIKLDEKIPVKISGNAVFGSLSLPGNRKAVFGSNSFQSPDFNSDKPFLEIEANVVFGEIEIR